MLKLKVPEKDLNFRISPRSVCALYLMLKLHFEGKYNVIKYNWKYGISQASFNVRRDKKFFEDIAYKYRIHELTYIFTSALLNKTDNWIGGMTSNDAINNYLKYDTMLKIYENEFIKELQFIFLYMKRENIKLSEVLKYNERRDSSRIIKMLDVQTIKYETFLILDSLFDIISKYDEVSESYEWFAYSTLLKAYRDILEIDIEKVVELFTKEVKLNLDVEIDKYKLLTTAIKNQKKFEEIINE